MNTIIRVVLAGALLMGCQVSGSPSDDQLAAGVWGGDDAGLIVTDTSAHVHVGCTRGDIHQTITLDPDGRFDVVGEHNIDAYPVDRGILHPARFIGAVAGRRLTLTVVLTDTLVSLGPVVLTFDRQPDMRMCPICRQTDERADGR